MADTFRTEAEKSLWAARRKTVINRLRTAIQKLCLADVLTTEVNGWALAVTAPPLDIVVSVNKPIYDAMGTDHAILVQRASRLEGYVPGKPMTREVRVDFAPGGETPSEVGELALADVVGWNAERLATRRLPDRVLVGRRVPRRRNRS